MAACDISLLDNPSFTRDLYEAITNEVGGLHDMATGRTSVRIDLEAKSLILDEYSRGLCTVMTDYVSKLSTLSFTGVGCCYYITRGTGYGKVH